MFEFAVLFVGLGLVVLVGRSILLLFVTRPRQLMPKKDEVQFVVGGLVAGINEPPFPMDLSSCQLHDDCDAADAENVALTGEDASHCYDPECEICGKGRPTRVKVVSQNMLN